MRSLVTGGAGFIGSHLVDALLDLGHEVIVLDNFSTGRPQNLTHVEKRIDLIECDIGVNGDWASSFSGANWVFHLAALADIVPSIQEPGAYFRSNVDGTFNVLQAARQAKVGRVIYVGSSSSYGLPSIVPTPEDADIDPQYPYALTKYLGGGTGTALGTGLRFACSVAAIFNVYESRSRTSGTYDEGYFWLRNSRVSLLP